MFLGLAQFSAYEIGKYISMCTGIYTYANILVQIHRPMC